LRAEPIAMRVVVHAASIIRSIKSGWACSIAPTVWGLGTMRHCVA
jgi:hypothetical protein